MILSVTFSKPTAACASLLGRSYQRIKIQRAYFSAQAPGQERYRMELFTSTQVFHQTLTEPEVADFLARNVGTAFKAVVERTDTEEITFLANRHGAVRELHRPAPVAAAPQNVQPLSGNNRVKRYLLPEGTPVPFLVQLGIMSESGAIRSQKHDKFRQINRFLEFIRDILPDVQALCVGEGGFSPERPLRIADFGCGKSYLTFAVWHYLHEVRGLAVDITGLDLKADVIAGCQKLAADCGCTGLHFAQGNIADYAGAQPPDVVITLHACDTATDYALEYAVRQRCAAILSVPCCQHEVNAQLERAGRPAEGNPFASLTHWGLIRERTAALVTDALRAETLEQHGYGVQVLEFIDAESTPKNLLLRAVRQTTPAPEKAAAARQRAATLKAALSIAPALSALLPD